MVLSTLNSDGKSRCGRDWFRGEIGSELYSLYNELTLNFKSIVLLSVDICY